jgi:inosose dehydratase
MSAFLINIIDIAQEVSVRSFVLSRRAVMRASAAAFVSPLLGSTVPAQIQLGTQTNAWAVNPDQIGTLYSVLQKIDQLGFSGFETGFRNFQSVTNNLKLVRAHLESSGLIFFGIHIFLTNYDKTTHIAPEVLYTEAIETGSALSAKHLILSGSPCQSKSDLANKATALNRAGTIAFESGLRVAYHNHSPEFQNGEREIRHLIENTDAKVVSFVMDAGHAFRAGADVPLFLSTYASRVIGVHLRDSKNGQEVPLGQGDFPLEATSRALRNANWSGWAMLEEERTDGSKPGDTAIVPAFNALRRAFSP